MTQFNDREKAFENKFQKDQELQFKVTARRNKLLGLWAAGKIGLTGDAAAAYAKEVVVSDFDEPGDKDVLRKLLQDFSKKNVDINEHAVRREMDRLFEQAKQEVAKEI
jgi:hypothetical protein